MTKKRAASSGTETKHGFLSAPIEQPDTPDYVIVQLRYESPVAYGPSGFSARAAAQPQANDLNSVLEKFDVRAVRSHFKLKSQDIRARVEVAGTLPSAPSVKAFAARGMDSTFIESGFVQVQLDKPREAQKLAKELCRRKAVWNAYVAPRPVPAAAAMSPNFEPSQGYLHSAPNGIGAMDVWRSAGAKGRGITVCDIEGNWNRTHEDLPRGIKLLGGTVIDELGWRDHGTAVLGEMVAQPGKAGCVGICHQATAAVQSAIIDGVFNTAGAITNAAGKLKPGDVLLIELQAVGPNNKYVAMQYWDDVYTAIKVATEKGITVVEAAGNGDENFDLPVFNGTGLQKDSGAIVVGAGVPPTNFADFQGADAGAYGPLGVPRSRIFFSNYGKILSVQAWGWHVTSLGYGDAQGGSSENRWYTLRFSGTSSASPIVTGAVACLQGHAKAKTGKPLTPSRVRDILIRTGTKQQAGPGVPLSQRIGPQPDLAVALAAI